jgi:hypothetical protein
MIVNPHAQRGFNLAWATELASAFDLEEMGNPTVNQRGDWFHIIDGQHRIAALKMWLGDGNWEEQAVECWTYKELTDQQEAEKFLRLQARLRPASFDEFRVAVKAGRETEAEVARLVEEAGLAISRTKGGISATGTLTRVYRRGGAEVLARTLAIIRQAYGEAGFESSVIDGVGLFVKRYSAHVRDDQVALKLAKAAGGVSGLLNKANQLKLQTGSNKSQCVAAAIVDTVNKGPGGRKLPSWWKSQRNPDDDL